MKKNSFIVSVFTCVAILAACSDIPKQAYYTHGQPEDLMVTTTKDTHFDITSKDSVKTILQWADKMKPTEAALKCSESSRYCNKIEQVLERNGIATTRAYAHNNSVTFTYQEVAARACENRYIDNMINPYNLTLPTAGCSIASNIVEMTADKRQITAPDIMDDVEARKGIQAMDQSMLPSKPDTTFTPLATQQSLQTQGGSR